MAERWAIDTSVVLGALVRADSDCAHVLHRIQDEKIEVVCSTLLIAECVSIHDPANDALMTALLESETIEWVQCTREIALAARMIARTYPGLKGADAVHVASAIAAKVTVFVGVDRAFPYGEVDGVHVCRPGDIPGQWPLRPHQEA